MQKNGILLKSYCSSVHILQWTTMHFQSEQKCRLKCEVVLAFEECSILENYYQKVHSPKKLYVYDIF